MATVAGMRSQRWAWTRTYAVPLFVASVVLVLLAGAGLTVVLVFERTGQRSGGGGGDQGQCIVGRWEMTAHTESFAGVRLTLDGPGAQVEYRPDGTAVSDYGDGTAFDGVVLGQTVPVTVSGTVTYRYEASDDRTYRVFGQESDATMTMEVAGLPSSQQYRYSDISVSFDCQGDLLQFDYPERNYHAEYRRID